MTPACLVALTTISGAAAASPDTLTLPVTLAGGGADMRILLSLEVDSGDVSFVLPDDFGFSRAEFALRDRFDESLSARLNIDGGPALRSADAVPATMSASSELLRRLVDRPQRFELSLVAHSDQGPLPHSDQDIVPHSDQGRAIVMRGGLPARFDMCLIGEYVITGQGGDPDGLSVGSLFINDTNNEISWDFAYSGVGPPTLFVIHAAPAGFGGDSVLGLGVGGGPGELSGSTIADPMLVDDILADPECFYIDLHNDEYPNGAVRGQIETPPCDWDLARDCVVNAQDIAELLGNWGNPYGAAELASLIGSWGVCEP